jgi:hypothetical protein
MITVRNRLVVVLATAGVVTVGGLTTAATAAGAATVSRCGNASLAVTRTYVDSGAGHSWMRLIYRNVTTRTCTVSGYPGLDAVGPKGHVLAHAERTTAGYGGGGHVGSVRVRPGRYASAGVEWLNFNAATGGSCRHAAAVKTIVANTDRVHRLPVAVTVCGLQVHPTVAGTPQYPHYGAAQHYWKQGAKANAANMNYYFEKARQHLKTAKIYRTQVAELTELISLPNTGLTKKQIKHAHADVKDLDRFFATPRLYY